MKKEWQEEEVRWIVTIKGNPTDLFIPSMFVTEGEAEQALADYQGNCELEVNKFVMKAGWTMVGTLTF